MRDNIETNNVTTPLPLKAKRYLSRDMSWLMFAQRVLDQAYDTTTTIYERLRFLSISATNLDEFFMIRVGSLYNYIDHKHRWVDNSGLHAVPFRKKLLAETKKLFQRQQECLLQHLAPNFKRHGFEIVTDTACLSHQQRIELRNYFDGTLLPLLTPITAEDDRSFMALTNKALVIGVTTHHPADQKGDKKLSFIQLPQNISRFFAIAQHDHIYFVPLEVIVREHLDKLFKNTVILSTTLFRVTRNGDFSIEENDETGGTFIETLRQTLQIRNTGRVVRVELEADYDQWLLQQLQKVWDIDSYNLYPVPAQSLVDFTGISHLLRYKSFEERLSASRPMVPPLTKQPVDPSNLLEALKEQDVLLHHPYNSFDWVLNLLNQAAADPYVLSIKMTIYRLATSSAVVAALCKAARQGKNVSVLIEAKARFDEENNLRAAHELERAGCLIMYGISNSKVHAKALIIFRQEPHQTTRYVHLASGNYNEETAQKYTDIGLLTTQESYANDVVEFFNVITGHSFPKAYETLLTKPADLRERLTRLIQQEAINAQQGLPCGIVIKVNALEDKAMIEALYKAAQAGVPIRLIVRSICCLVPGVPGLSENITVRSIIGRYLEHARIFYFHHQGNPKVYAGSADIMFRSFDKRVEVLFAITDPHLKQQTISLLNYNLQDNVNAYLMQEDGTYVKQQPRDNNQAPFNIHQEFFQLTPAAVQQEQIIF